MNKEKRTVLFVDDEPYVLSALTRALNNFGMVLVTSSSAQEALRMLKRETFQVIVTDYNMPEMMGPEFLKAAEQIQPRAVRVVLTGASDLATIQKFTREGRATRYVLKPWDPQDLKDTLEECFQIYQEQTETDRRPA